MAVRALSSVKSGPPNNPACWPVTMATVRGSRSRAAGGDGLRGSRSRALLRGYDVGDGIALARVPLNAGDGVAPRRGIPGIPGEEPRDARVVARVVGRELLDPGKPPYVDGNAGDGLGEACLGRHQVVLSQALRAVSRQRVTIRCDYALAFDSSQALAPTVATAVGHRRRHERHFGSRGRYLVPRRRRGCAR